MLGRDYYASARYPDLRRTPSSIEEGRRLTYLSYRLAMLHLLIHAQFGYLIHPSIKLPSAKESEEPLRIADVGTGTGCVRLALIFMTHAAGSTC